MTVTMINRPVKWLLALRGRIDLSKRYKKSSIVLFKGYIKLLLENVGPKRVYCDVTRLRRTDW